VIYLSDTKDLTLLILTPDFPDKDNRYIGSIFIKDQLEGIKKYFKKVIIISPILYSFKILSNDKFCINYVYDNVEIYYPRCLFIPKVIPILSDNRKLYFDFRYYAIKHCIDKYNIKFDLIHSHFTYPASYCAALLKERYKIPYVMTINEDSGWLSEELSSGSSRVQRAWTDANKIITINKFDSNKLSLYNSNRVTIPYSFNKRYFKRDMYQCRQLLDLPDDIKILFSFGILQQRKGFEYLIESMNIIKNMRSDVHCYIGGKSEIEKSYEIILKDMVSDLDLDDYVHFIGFLEDYDIPLWFNACDLYVSSSLNEGLGITQIEAIACGKPIVATNTNGSRYIIDNDEIGLLCKQADSNDLANKILEGLNYKWNSDRILQFCERYRQENIANQLLKVYNEVLRNER
jgi:teichuronic acid biosynthesis glycosyltransferase TuaC